MNPKTKFLLPPFIMLLTEAIVYVLISGVVKLSLYALLCAAISFGALLLKITNLGGSENPLNVVKPEHHQALRKMNETLSNIPNTNPTSKYDNLLEILSYLIVVCVNCAIVYITG